MDAETVRTFVRELPDYELGGGSPFAGADAGLRRTAKLLDLLGRPDVRYLVAQVAGTNGKGSTAAMLAAIVERAGARAGLYTSPHLRRWEERIRISGRPIDDALIAAAGALVLDAALQLAPEDGQLTRFEFWTALACVAFGLASCRVAVLEVGLGGRYDATTAARVDLAVLTRIALDHTNILGSTLAAIAAEKAAIIGRRMPAVSAPQEDEARAVIVARAAEMGGPLLLGGREVTYRRTAAGLDVTVLGQTYEALAVPLRGTYQDENAATAVAAALALGVLGIKMGPEMVAEGLAGARWPGRFEVVDDVVLDGAHNPDGARALADALRAAFPGEKFIFVIGAHRDKDLHGMLSALAPLAARIVAVGAATARARSAKAVADEAKTYGVRAQVAESVGEGLALARQPGARAILAPGVSQRVVVCGSLAVIGEARAALGLAE